MDKSQIVLNTLVFDQQHQAGLAQPDMLQKVVDFGITNVEIRREYFNSANAENEANTIRDFVKTNNLRLLYSVPEVIFDETGHLNPDIEKYFQEAQRMGVYSLKMNIGRFDKFSGDLKTALDPLTATGIQFNVENDQTAQNGTIGNILTFLKAVQAAGVDIKFVFDLGNWRFVGEDENDAADQLSDYVRYIHVKNAESNGANWSVVKLDAGVIDWQKTLKKLPTDLPVAIEYPASDDEIQAGIKLLANY